jgi:hypothetical protein
MIEKGDDQDWTEVHTASNSKQIDSKLFASNAAKLVILVDDMLHLQP